MIRKWIRPLHRLNSQFLSNKPRGIVSVVDLIQTSVAAIHSYSYLPWWSSFGLSTIFVRASMLPLVNLQLLESKKLAAAMPEIAMLSQLLKNRMITMPNKAAKDRLQVISVFVDGVRASCTIHDVKFHKIIAYPMINLSVFCTFVYSLRDMLIKANASYNLQDGGFGMFCDMTVKDPTFILPFTAICLSYSALEYAFRSTPGKGIELFKDFVQCILVLSIPVVTTLPAGVFFYWIPSSIFGIAQTAVMRSRSMRPPLPP
jgi:YidC/Oxa1 family membrane protein insertase